MTTSNMSTAPCCPKCGFDLELPSFEDTQEELLQAHRKIEDLQVQVRLLNQKASAAIDRWADYEDEIAKVRSALDTSQKQQQQQQQQQQHAPQQATTVASPSRTSFLSARAASRISALLSPRKLPPNLYFNNPSPSPSPRTAYSPALPLPSATSPAPPLSPTPSSDELLEALSREQSLRLAAEGRLSDTSREVEELSATLFEQANEMVASERRARAALEERVETLERRDAEKRRRLGRLEAALGSIERARALLLGDGAGGGVGAGGGGGGDRAAGEDREVGGNGKRGEDGRASGAAREERGEGGDAGGLSRTKMDEAASNLGT